MDPVQRQFQPRLHHAPGIYQSPPVLVDQNLLGHLVLTIMQRIIRCSGIPPRINCLGVRSSCPQNSHHTRFQMICSANQSFLVLCRLAEFRTWKEPKPRRPHEHVGLRFFLGRQALPQRCVAVSSKCVAHNKVLRDPQIELWNDSLVVVVRFNPSAWLLRSDELQQVWKV